MSPLLQISLQAIVLAVMIVGLLGLIFPIIPGLVIIWVAALGYYLAVGFDKLAIFYFVLQTIMMLGGSVIDNILMGATARKYGASWLAIAVALITGLLGSIFFPPLGGVVAALVGVFLVEFLRLNDWKAAFNSTRGLFLGCGWSVVIRFALGVLMVLLWLAWVYL